MSERRLATALLGRRLLARAARARRTGGRMLARSVAAARRPAMLPVITRLVPRPDRAAGAEPPRPGGEAADAPVPRPAGMSEFAARWVFGDGPAEGVPLPAVDVAPEVGDTAAPEPEQIGGQAPVAAADTARSTGAGGAAPPAPQRVPRGRVDEGAGDGGSPAPAGRRRFSRHPGAGAGEQPSPGKRVAASGQGRGEASAIPDARGPTTAPAGPSSGEPAPSHADEGPARAAGDRDPDSGHRARIVLRRPSKAGERARPRPRIRPRSEPELRPLPPARRGLLRRAADRVLGRRAS
ncbi:MAG TPA: hypothetical protein VK919_00065, partial [Solirubrobacterales bacterium]|nr:hypothetical protein [Solirubrobacterales bacterium]